MDNFNFNFTFNFTLFIEFMQCTVSILVLFTSVFCVSTVNTKVTKSSLQAGLFEVNASLGTYLHVV